MLVGTTEWKQRENMSYLSVVKANLGVDVRPDIITRGHCHSLPRLVNVLPADKMMPGGIRHHQVHLLACYLVHLELSCDQDVFVDLLLQTFPRKEEDTGALFVFDRNPLLSIRLEVKHNGVHRDD